MSKLAVLIERESPEQILYTRLLQDRGYDVIAINTLDQFYGVINEQAIDLLVFNANEYIHYLDANEFNEVVQITPSIVMTNNSFAINRHTQDFNAVIQQPFTFNNLLNAVQQVSAPMRVH